MIRCTKCGAISGYAHLVIKDTGKQVWKLVFSRGQRTGYDPAEDVKPG